MKLTLITLNHCFINIDGCTHICITDRDVLNAWRKETRLLVGDVEIVSCSGASARRELGHDIELGIERDKMMRKILKYICDEIFKKHYVIDIRKLEKQLNKI